MNNYDIKKEKNMKNVKLNFDDKPEKPNFFAEYSKSRESEQEIIRKLQSKLI